MISMKKAWLVVCSMFVLSGCGGRDAGVVKSPGAADPQAVGWYEPGAGAPAGDGPTVGAESPGSARASARAEGAARESYAPPEPSPESRPGLGTEWGETRTSRVHDVTFERASSAPFAVATVHYNDRRGVGAMAGYRAEIGRPEVDLADGAVSLSLRDADGDPLETIRSSGRTLVVGRAGERYSIVLTNHTGRRLESVVTVDGLDVVTGRPGSTESRGYVLSPYGTLEIEGFRQSTTAVAAFRFASVADSYAAQTGSARNVGVIGVALFAERGAVIDARELRLRETASPFPADPRFAEPPRR